MSAPTTSTSLRLLSRAACRTSSPFLVLAAPPPRRLLSSSSLPRVAQPSFWASLVPRALRRTTPSSSTTTTTPPSAAVPAPSTARIPTPPTAATAPSPASPTLLPSAASAASSSPPPIHAAATTTTTTTTSLPAAAPPPAPAAAHKSASRRIAFLALVAGSLSINTLAQRQASADRARAAEGHAARLREVVERVARGEEMEGEQVREALLGWDREKDGGMTREERERREREWEGWLREVESEDVRWRENKLKAVRERMKWEGKGKGGKETKDGVERKGEVGVKAEETETQRQADETKRKVGFY